jgi:hypothetical protein
VAILGKLNPLNLLKTCKNQQAMLTGKTTQNQQCEEKFMFLGQKFFSLKTCDKRYLSDPSTMLR